MSRESLHEDFKPQVGAPEKLAYRNIGDVAKMKPAKLDAVELRLRGVDHTARPTWKLNETVTFYRDILGLPVIHAITARGWGHEDHADFLHFFFDAGNGATIAFFYYIGTERPELYEPSNHPFFTATHTAWAVDTQDELQLWKETLEARGVVVSPYTKHEGLESIYFRDPNGYPVEVTRRLRDVEEIDAVDAELTLEAAMQIERSARSGGEPMRDIDTIWRRKAKLVEEHLGA